MSKPGDHKGLKPVCPRCCRVLIERGLAKPGKLCQACRFNDAQMHKRRGVGRWTQ